MNYSWSCSGISGGASSPACTASYTPSVPVPVFDLHLKKYINNDDAQPNAPVAANSGSTFNYIIRVTNDGPANVSGTTTVTDTLPAGIAPNGTISASGWSCTGTTSISCTRSNTLGSGVSFPEIVVPVIVTATTGTITNTATVVNPAENPNNPNRAVDNTDPAVIVIAPPGVGTPNLSIKKYAKEISAVGDTQTAPISIARGEAFNYYYQLLNTGSIAATGVVVKDTLPSYLPFSGAITVRTPAGADVTANWTCVQGSQVFAGETITRITLVCSKLTPLPANSGVYTFTVPVVLSANAPININMQNVVYVCADNVVANPTGPNGEAICGNINPPPPPPPGQCDKTNPNSQKDPACIVVPPPVCTVNCGGG